MTYRLYNRDGSGGFAVEAALALAGAPFVLERLESVPSTPLPDSFRAMNPWGQVPVLIAPDGAVMTECAAILAWLATRHPGPGVGPSPDEAAYGPLLRWLTFMATSIYEAVLRMTYPVRYTDDPDGEAAMKRAADRRKHAAFLLLEAEIADRPFLLGDEMSGADLMFAMLYAWHKDRPDLPRGAALTHRVAADPVVAPIWRRNFDHRMKERWGRP